MCTRVSSDDSMCKLLGTLNLFDYIIRFVLICAEILDASKTLVELNS